MCNSLKPAHSTGIYLGISVEFSIFSPLLPFLPKVKKIPGQFIAKRLSWECFLTAPQLPEMAPVAPSLNFITASLEKAVISYPCLQMLSGDCQRQTFFSTAVTALISSARNTVVVTFDLQIWHTCISLVESNQQKPFPWCK